MKQIISKKVMLFLAGVPGAGKTWYLTASHSYGKERGGFFKNGKETIYLKGDNPELDDSSKEIKKGNYKYYATRDDNLLYKHTLTYKDFQNVSSQPICEIIIRDLMGGSLEGLQTYEDIEDIDISKLDLEQSDSLSKCIVWFVPLSQFFGCLNQNKSCNYEKSINCKQFKPVNAKFTEKTAEFCKFNSRLRIKKALKALYGIKKEFGVDIVLAINHCWTGNEVEYSNEIKKAGEILDEYLEDVFVDVKKPHYYFIDTLACFNNIEEFSSNVSYPILDLLISFLKEAEVNERSKFNQMIFGSARELKERCIRLLQNKINFGG